MTRDEKVTRLIQLAKSNGVDYAMDIYPHYSSDATVAWRAGADVRAAPDVEAHTTGWYT